ncbi:putative quinol monooxygenase [Chitinophaga agri]|uniref:Antibiotic biosynthesis monooxygenase n=1 Tax=Chitinophaga agri TaxID=2703787 RepID=A0A6B9ZFC1_9BACT|nr:putative quinol monooxygenase [Chitinophaga agri]QHS59243.1 antibiotic biosynthesis monooxygenase [Chitinophaga agri]
MKVYLTAIVKARPEHRDTVLSVLLNMVEQTRKEEDCQLYDLHNSTDDRNVFFFYEIWESQEALDAHNQQPYIQEFVKIAGELLQEPPVIIKADILFQ